MNVNVVDPKFNIPSVAKYTLAFDKELAWKHVVFSAEFQHLDVVNGILYQNINLGTPTGLLPDGRLSYARTPTAAPGSANTSRWNANPSFGQQVILLTNTNKGESDNLTLSLAKPFADNWSAKLAYTHSRASDVNPGTSSVANSSFQNRDWVNPNDDHAAVSNYSIPDRVIATVTWQHNFFGDNPTQISAFYDGHSGAPYSWIFGNDVNGDSYTHDLAYVPRAADVVFTRTTLAVPGLTDSFFQYIGNDRKLASHQGEIFDRNGGRAPWISQLDLSLKQKLPGSPRDRRPRSDWTSSTSSTCSTRTGAWSIARISRWNGHSPTPLACARQRSRPIARAVPRASTCTTSPGTVQPSGKYSPQALPVNESFNPSQRWSILATLRYTF